MDNVKIYTDGANNKYGGGWAYIVVKNNVIIDEDYGKCSDTTNNRMELTAIIKALEYAYKTNVSATIVSDSQYCIYSINKNWKRKKNLDLWQAIDELINNVNVTFEWTKGHADTSSNDSIYNNRVDTLAVRGSQLL